MEQKPKPNFVPIAVTLAPQMVAQLDEIAERNGLKNRSALVRQALTGYIMQDQKEQRKAAA